MYYLIYKIIENLMSVSRNKLKIVSFLDHLINVKNVQVDILLIIKVNVN